MSVTPAKSALRVLILSEIRILSEGLARGLGADERFSICDPALSLREAVARLPSLQPEIVLLDASLPDGSGSVGRVHAGAPRAKVVVFAVAETPDNIIDWAEAGAVGYIPRTASLTDIAPLLLGIAGNEQPCTAQVAAGLLSRLGSVARAGRTRGEGAISELLTSRELQIIELICAGLSNKEIARRLNIGLATTKSHVHSLLGKLKLQRRTQAALWLHQRQEPASRPLSGLPTRVGSAEPRPPAQTPPDAPAAAATSPDR